MPTRKDKTNVAPIYREQVFIPASGHTKFMQEFRKRTPRGGNLEIVSPEFDLLTGIRGINSLFNNVIGKKLPSNYAYRRASKQELDDIISTKSFRKIPDNVEVEGGRTITLPNGKTVTFKKAKGNSHGGKAFSAGEVWKGTTSSGNKSSEIIIGVPGNNVKWQVGHHGSYTEPIEFNKISKGEGLFVPFDDNGIADVSIEGLKQFTPTRFKNRYIDQDVKMKCGGRRKAQSELDIREGGIAQPIANNMWYIHGRKHEDGGVTMGPNNKNGVEVEGGEVVEMIDSNHPSVGRQFKAGGQQQTMRVFSSVPFLRGVSPAQLVMGGANPNKVFKAQEEFKDRNRINDDGTTYEVGGEKNININNLPSSFRGRKIGNSYYQIGVPPSTNKIKSGVTGFKNYLKGLNDDLDEFGVTFTQVSKKVMPKPLRDTYAKIVNALYKTNKIDKINTAANQIGTASMATDKKKFGGSMIYEINGNVRNGLNLRPKAEWGKGKDEGKWQYPTDPKNFVRGYSQITPYGKIYSDGDSYLSVNGSNLMKNSYEFMTEAIKYQADKRPQYYAEKRLPIAGNQSIAEKAGLSRSGWSYGDSSKIDYRSYTKSKNTVNGSTNNAYISTTKSNTGESYVINPLTGEWIRNGVTETPEPSVKGTTKVTSKPNSTARGRVTKTSTPKSASQSTPTIQDTVNKITTDALKASKTPKIDLSKAKMPNYNVSDLGSKESKAAKAKLNTSSTGGGTQSKEAPWIPQYNTITGRDWLGVGTNLAGHIASYFANNSLLKKAPMPTKPVSFQAAKLKTTHNINPELSNIDEVAQMNLAEVGRNTSSSSTSLARKQRIMNEARDARNKLYGQKENIETQLINLDKRNRQDVYNRNIAAYNDWLDKTYVAKSNNLLNKQRNLTNLISGIPSAVNNMLGTIETRKSTNDMIRAIAAANPNVDGRLLGIGDYYTQKQSNGRTAVYNKNHKLVKYV